MSHAIEPSRGRMSGRLRHALFAVLLGAATWGGAYLGIVILRNEDFAARMPGSIQLIVGILGLICGFLAYPLAAVGWLALGGYSGPDHHWSYNTPLHAFVAVSAYALLWAGLFRGLRKFDGG